MRYATEREWVLPFGLGVVVPCHSTDPRRLFEGSDGICWRKKSRRYLVAPDNLDDRGPHTVIFRGETELVLTAPMMVEEVYLIAAE